jgi:hypothetical protein
MKKRFDLVDTLLGMSIVFLFLTFCFLCVPTAHAKCDGGVCVTNCDYVRRTGACGLPTTAGSLNQSICGQADDPACATCECRPTGRRVCGCLPPPPPPSDGA